MKRIILLLIIAIAARPGFSQPGSDLYCSAKSAYVAEDFQGAINHLDEAIVFGKQGNFYKLRGDCFQKLGDFGSALADYDFAERRGCTDLDLNLNRGICRISMGLFEQAEKDLYLYIEAFPDEAKAHYYLGEANYMMFDNKISVGHLSAAIMLDDDYMEAHYLLGANYSEMGKMNLARDEFQICRRLQPDYIRIDLNLAILALANASPNEAIDILSRIIPESDKFKAEVHFYLGEAYYALHNQEQACLQWSAAADLGDSYGKKNYKNICIKENGRHKKRKTLFVEF